jgi:hypothetical protein
MGVLLPVMDFLARRAFLGAGLFSHTLTLPSSGSFTIHYLAPPRPRLRAHGHVVVAAAGGPALPPLPRDRPGPPLLRRLVLRLQPAAVGVRARRAARRGRGGGARRRGRHQLRRVRGLRAGEGGGTVQGWPRGGVQLRPAQDRRRRRGAPGRRRRRVHAHGRPAHDARRARRLMELSFYRRQAISVLPDLVIRGAVRVTKGFRVFFRPALTYPEPESVPMGFYSNFLRTRGKRRSS